MADKKCVLVVDDHPDSVKLVSTILERNGFDTLTATSGEESIRKTRTEYPDLILMDIMMPQMTGVDACRALREDRDPRVANSTIVMFSASASRADRDAAEAAEADGHIVKPTKPAVLIEMINRFLINPRKPNIEKGVGKKRTLKNEQNITLTGSKG